MKVDAKKLPVISARDARRALLHAQGLLDDPSRAATAASLQKLIEQMGFVQIDTINVVERAHHLTLLSRLDQYRPELLANLLEKKRSLFEHWTHDASAIPTKWFAHWKHRFARYRERIPENKWWGQRMGSDPNSIIAHVMDHISQRGPMLSRDFEHNRNGEPPPEEGWWGWKPQKAALEYLWRRGDLSVVKRINFQKVYDLTERVFPQQHASPAPDLEEHIDWACRSALERLAFATPAEIAAFWNAIDLAQARAWCHIAAQIGEIVPVTLESADESKPRTAFALADWEVRLKRVPRELPEAGAGRIRILSPFDPVLRDRKRTARLFNFDYTFEAFTPAPKRRYGYYVLPMLQGDQLIGRLDPKFHRAPGGRGRRPGGRGGVLEIKGVWWEPKVQPTKIRQMLLDDALARLAAFIRAKSIAMPGRT